MSSGQDRRAYTRIPLEGQVRIQGPSGGYDAQLQDISLKGMLVSRPEGWNGPREATYRLTVELADGALTLHTQGRLVHSHKDRLGFVLVYIDLESVGHLRRLVELNTGDEALLKRELANLANGL